MNEQKSTAKISATLVFTETGKIQSVNLNAETDGDTATLSRALDQILKPKDEGAELEEIAIRLKLSIAIIENATLECKLARLQS
jgi:hypothetical protein